MHYINLFGRDTDGEPNVWWSWQNLNKKGSGFWNGRAWLHFTDNCVGVQWVPLSRRCAIGLEFSTTSDSNISFNISVPFVVSLYFSIDRARWVKHLPGVKWNGHSSSGDREISFRIFNNALWWRLWRNPMEGYARDWRDSCFHFDDFILGRNKHSKSDHSSGDYLLVMPEGAYPVKIELYTSTWKRPRWPWFQSVRRASIETEHGVPIPGKGENSYDCEDDALYGGTYSATTVDEALQKMHDSVMRDRLRYGGSEWIPSAGWPEHCVR